MQENAFPVTQVTSVFPSGFSQTNICFWLALVSLFCLTYFKVASDGSVVSYFSLNCLRRIKLDPHWWYAASFNAAKITPLWLFVTHEQKNRQTENWTLLLAYSLWSFNYVVVQLFSFVYFNSVDL